MHLKRQNSWPLDVIDHDALIDYTCIVYKTNNKYYEILTIYECVERRTFFSISRFFSTYRRNR